MKKRIILSVLWTLILLILLFYPLKGSNIPDWGDFHYWDKIAHFCLFSITGCISVFGTSFFNRLRNRILFGLVFGLALALGTEAGQYLLPSRTASLHDLFADVAGLMAGLLFYLLLYSNNKLRSRLRL